ncbi:hypothetical protein BZG02_12780 [Labilibaculum filiforme]|uniref:DUF4238 domain-containing protein n=1 Tax=Labilibaculum filiforme TaxID=1940526 RepID=A0A2N3HWY0_9BACT|nr:DUF4238 domain-containing protein [Labilibaculum filiforme]PKQ62586.1 hypothetical protein BZG02_12780 [Labilibaculum filiforme]
MALTKNNHYNPCFWTANWNFEYYKSKSNNHKSFDKPRNQVVHCLNLRKDEIISQKVCNIFFEKKAGLAIVTKEARLSYCKRYFPEEYPNYQKLSNEDDNGDLTLDFENHFTGMEDLYKEILNSTIENGKVENIAEKTSLSYFLLVQTIRNHNTLRKLNKHGEFYGRDKFEILLYLKHKLSNKDEVMEMILPYLSSKWTFYNLSKFKFPLSDCPILVSSSNIMVALSPNLLLEIELNNKVLPKEICQVKKRISYFKYRQFQKRTIENSSREIIFGEKELLENWKKSKIYRNHLDRISKLFKNKPSPAN